VIKDQRPFKTVTTRKQERETNILSTICLVMGLVVISVSLNPDWPIALHFVCGIVGALCSIVFLLILRPVICRMSLIR
jgi:hypothetical protein